MSLPIAVIVTDLCSPPSCNEEKVQRATPLPKFRVLNPFRETSGVVPECIPCPKSPVSHLPRTLGTHLHEKEKI